MKIHSLVAQVLLGAAAIVGAVFLARSPARVTPVDAAYRQVIRAEHTFIPAASAASAIVCPVVRQPDWERRWTPDHSQCSLGDGWLPPNRWGSFVFGATAEAVVHVDRPADATLSVTIKAGDDIPDDHRQAFRLFINDRDLGKHLVDRRWETIRIPVAAQALSPGVNLIRFVFDHWVSPRQAGTGSDYRAVAARVSRLSLTPVNAPESAPPTSDPWDDSRGEWIVRRSGVLSMPVQLPPGAATMAVRLRPSTDVDPGSLTVEMRIEDLDGGPPVRVTSKRSTSDAGIRFEAPVGELAGGWALLTLALGFEGGFVVIEPPEITGRAPREATGAVRRTAGTSRPDIVVIILDAARADRFSHAGYPRDTTPFIDSIAAESVVFPNAYALAPYTLCSVPTMITGLSFFDHGVTRHDHVLDGRAVTLAERLRGLGYRTAAFSATPNNSRSKGFDQGYEVFRELWTEGPQRVTRHAHYLADQVAAWLAETADDPRPLHLQLHLIPPHSPYDPRPPFDVFTESAPSESCNGFDRTISRLDGREGMPDPDCISHLSDLYDGNLRTADDAVRIVVEALRLRPSWDNTVLLITSDHGEAFWEHGRLAHNSTVFGEMLRVPFILRLPPGFERPGITTDRLVTLADIAPTLLSAAGFHIDDASIDGVDLLDGDGAGRGRFLIARTTDGPPVFGLRTLRWSATLNSAGAGSLYDLTFDPGELRDRRTDRPEVFAALANLINRRMTIPPDLHPSAGVAEIGDEERELLETLGYVTD